MATNSALQNLSRSRLPEFTINQKNVLKGSYDLLFLNHYSAQLVSLGNLSEYDSTVSWTSDKQVTSSLHETWNTTNIGFVVSFSIKKLQRCYYTNLVGSSSFNTKRSDLY